MDNQPNTTDSEPAQQKSAAQNLGNLLAHVQDGIDFFVEMGFKGMKAAANTGSKGNGAAKEEDTHPALQTAKKAGRGLLKFLGEAGDAFYTKYGELKNERSKKTS